MQKQFSSAMSSSIMNKQEKCRDFSQCALDYIEMILSEEFTDDDVVEANATHNPLALLAMENSFYQALTEKDKPPPPPLPNHHPPLSSSEKNNGRPSEWTFLLNHTDCVFQFRRGVEEANKFLPREIRICENFDKTNEEEEEEVLLRHPPPPRSSSNKHPPPPPDDNGAAALIMEGESCSKEGLVTPHGVDEDELSAMLDGLYLDLVHDSRALSRTKQQQQKKTPVMMMSCASALVLPPPDLSSLVMSCARATAADDHATAMKALKQIREQSTPFGFGSQRLAHYFANALEARFNVGFSRWADQAEFMSWPSASDYLKMVVAHIPV